MSDRTYAQAIVYACPEAERAAAFAALEWAGERPTLDAIKPDPDDAGTWQFPDPGILTLDATYGEDEMPLDANDSIGADLREAAPGATFAVWVDPKYEYSGMLTMYAPGLGSFTATCDADGCVTPDPDRLRDLVDRRDWDGIRDMMGEPWRDAIKAARRELGYCDRCHAYHSPACAPSESVVAAVPMVDAVDRLLDGIAKARNDRDIVAAADLYAATIKA